MRSSTVLRLPLVLALAAAPLAACSSDDGGDDDTTYNCELDDRDEPFTANMQRTGPGGVTFTIVEGDPVQLKRGSNVWTIEVSKDGAPLTGVDATLKLTSYMPDHMHMSASPDWVPVEGMPGRYTVSPVILWMPGVWEITLEATPAGMPRDSVLFKFCLTA